VSTKDNLRNKIKRKTAAQTFFNQYDDIQDNSEESKGNPENNTANNDDTNKTYVINNNIDNNDVNDDDVEVATQVPSSTSKDEDYFRSLAQGRRPKRKKANKVFTSFYMDPDLAEEVDKIVKNGVKGDKSRLINTGIRKLLEDYGVL